MTDLSQSSQLSSSVAGETRGTSPAGPSGMLMPAPSSASTKPSTSQVSESSALGSPQHGASTTPSDKSLPPVLLAAQAAGPSSSAVGPVLSRENPVAGPSGVSGKPQLAMSATPLVDPVAPHGTSNTAVQGSVPSGALAAPITSGGFSTALFSLPSVMPSNGVRTRDLSHPISATNTRYFPGPDRSLLAHPCGRYTALQSGKPSSTSLVRLGSSCIQTSVDGTAPTFDVHGILSPQVERLVARGRIALVGHDRRQSGHGHAGTTFLSIINDVQLSYLPGTATVTACSKSIMDAFLLEPRLQHGMN